MSNKQLSGDDPHRMLGQIAERIEGHARGYDLVIYARPGQWKALIDEYERLRTVEQAARLLIKEGIRMTPDGAIIIENPDRSDPHWKLCEALDAIDKLNSAPAKVGTA